MIKDRGMKKWAGMMLTEHVHLLKQYNEEQSKVLRPELDEWDLDIIQENIEIALKTKVDTKIKRWVNGEFLFNRGIVEKVDLKRRIIKLQDPFYLLSLDIDEIVDVTVME